MHRVFGFLADGIVYGLLGVTPGTHLAATVHFFVADVMMIFTLLVTVIFVMGVVRSYVPLERVRRLLSGRSRWVGYAAAVLLGAVTPFCSCSSVVFVIGFLEAGIPVGVTMAFLIASPMINEVAVVVLLGILGWKFTALYVAVGLAVGVLAGVLIDTFGLQRWVEDYVWSIQAGQAEGDRRTWTPVQRVRFARGEVREIVGRIWPWILLGVGVGAFLHGHVPESFFSRYASATNPFAVPVAVLAGVPMYANATGIIPVAEALLGKGVPVGTVLALMMSVVALSLPEMIILRKVLKPRMLACFAGYLAVAFLMVGYVFNIIRL